MDVQHQGLADVDPLVLASSAGRGVHHRFNADRYTTLCGLRVRRDDRAGTHGLPGCASCDDHVGVARLREELAEAHAAIRRHESWTRDHLDVPGNIGPDGEPIVRPSGGDQCLWEVIRPQGHLPPQTQEGL